jgi:hypothetical protein
MRVSITSIDTNVPSAALLQREYSAKMLFMEILLKGILKTPLPFAVKCIAVLKIIPNGHEYLSRMDNMQRRFMVC